MFEAINHLTDKERQELSDDINQKLGDSKIDQDSILEAMDTCFINDLIHIQQMKNGLCRNMGLKPIHFSADDYRRIGKFKKEEDKREELSIVMTEKMKEVKEDDIEDCDKMQSILKKADSKNNIVGGIDTKRLTSLLERISHLEDEKKAISSDISDIFSEAKSAGFDCKIMRTILKLRKMNAADRDEQEYLLETYRKALDI